MIHFQGQKVGSCDFGLLQREAQSSRLVRVDGARASVALVGTWVCPRISHPSKLCVLGVKILRPSPGPDRDRLAGTQPWRPRWAPPAEPLPSWRTEPLRPGQAAGAFLGVTRETARQQRPGTFLLSGDRSSWDASLRQLAFAQCSF